MAMRNAWGLVIGAGLITMGGCRGRHGGAELDVCANGACEQTVNCELGACMDPYATLAPSQTRARIDPNAGTTRERTNAECPFAKGEIPPYKELVDDSDIPEFNRGRTRRSNMNAGDGFLQDWELHERLLGVQGAFFECLDLAACYEKKAPAQTGELDFQFELEPDGRVSAVSVAPSKELDQPIIRACARRSLYQARFPSWKGGRMIVDYSLEISIQDDV